MKKIISALLATAMLVSMLFAASALTVPAEEPVDLLAFATLAKSTSGAVVPRDESTGSYTFNEDGSLTLTAMAGTYAVDFHINDGTAIVEGGTRTFDPHGKGFSVDVEATAPFKFAFGFSDVHGWPASNNVDWGVSLVNTDRVPAGSYQKEMPLDLSAFANATTAEYVSRITLLVDLNADGSESSVTFKGLSFVDMAAEPTESTDGSETTATTTPSEPPAEKSYVDVDSLLPTEDTPLTLTSSEPDGKQGLVDVEINADGSLTIARSTDESYTLEWPSVSYFCGKEIDLTQTPYLHLVLTTLDGAANGHIYINGVDLQLSKLEHGDANDFTAPIDVYVDLRDWISGDKGNVTSISLSCYGGPGATLVWNTISTAYDANEPVVTEPSESETQPSETQPSEPAATYESIGTLVPADADVWFSADAQGSVATVAVSEDGVVSIGNTAGSWPAAYTTYDTPFVVDPATTVIRYDFTVKDKSDVILFFGSATPAEYQQGDYLAISQYIGALSESNELLGGTFTAELALSDLALPDGAYDADGNVVISGIKIFATSPAMPDDVVIRLFDLAKPAESQPSETETQPSETETQPSETQPSETQPSETQPSETQPSEPIVPAVPGDLDGNGTVELEEVLNVYLYSAGENELTADMVAKADVDGNGILNMHDAYLIFLAYSGK